MLHALGRTLVSQAAAAKPDLAAASRAGILAASSLPKRKRARGGILRFARVDRGLTSSVRSATTLGLVTGPQIAITQAADRAVGGPPVTPEQQARHRQVMLAANGAAVLAGMLAQRTVIHALPRSAGSDAARFLAQQLAFGGAAGALIAATDAVLGERGPAKMDRKAAAVPLGGLIFMAQAIVLGQARKLVVLDPGPSEVAMPVLGLGGIRAITVPVSSGRLIK